MADVTRILSAIEDGDPAAAEQLLPLVYDELRKLATAKMAHEKPGQTLQPTALVHEAYLRLVGQAASQKWDGRGHFFAAAAEAMRRLLIENARRKGRAKRGGHLARHDFESVQFAVDSPPEELLALDEALEKFSAEHPEKATLVELRFFVGLTVSEAANSLGMSVSTAERHWTFARAWLFRHLNEEETD